MASTTMTDDMIEQGRMVARLSGICGDVLAENIQQIKKWGVQNHRIAYFLGILMEEVGEVAEAIAITEPTLTTQEEMLVDAIYQLGLRAKAFIEGDTPNGISRVNAATHVPDLGKELIQVAAVATSIEEWRRYRREAK